MEKVISCDGLRNRPEALFCPRCGQNRENHKKIGGSKESGTDTVQPKHILCAISICGALLLSVNYIMSGNTTNRNKDKQETPTNVVVDSPSKDSVGKNTDEARRSVRVPAERVGDPPKMQPVNGGERSRQVEVPTTFPTDHRR